MVAKICPSYLKMITKLKMIVKDDSWLVKYNEIMEQG